MNHKTISWITKPVLDPLTKRIVGRDFTDDSGDFYRLRDSGMGTYVVTAQLRGKPFTGEFSSPAACGHAVQAEYRRREWDEKHG